MKSIKLAIDASNLRGGGGLTHLRELLAAANPAGHGIESVEVFASRATLEALTQRPWLKMRPLRALDGSLPARACWQRQGLRREIKDSGCHALYSPGGVLPSKPGVPAITMSQNMLPFMPLELNRYPFFSLIRLRLKLLRGLQGRSFSAADAVIFLTRFAEETILPQLSSPPKRSAIIPHGIDPRFFMEPRSPVPLEECSKQRPCRVLYVSIVDVYKHQWNVARAAAKLRQAGIPVEVSFIGPAYPPALRRFNETLNALDPSHEFLHYKGAVPYESLHSSYHEADAFVFASSCENLPIIMLEAMAAGLPIVSSNQRPMSDILAEKAEFFDPESPGSIAGALRNVMENAELRGRLARASHKTARSFSWDSCAEETFRFIADIAGGDP